MPPKWRQNSRQMSTTFHLSTVKWRHKWMTSFWCRPISAEHRFGMTNQRWSFVWCDQSAMRTVLVWPISDENSFGVTNQRWASLWCTQSAWIICLSMIAVWETAYIHTVQISIPVRNIHKNLILVIFVSSRYMQIAKQLFVCVRLRVLEHILNWQE